MGAGFFFAVSEYGGPFAVERPLGVSTHDGSNASRH